MTKEYIFLVYRWVKSFQKSGSIFSQKIQDLDIHPKSLYAWVTAYKKEHNMPIRNLEKSTILKESEAEELKRLRRENKILKQERDILKKATAYFAKETL